MSGKDIFTFNPSIVQGEEVDEEAADFDLGIREEEDVGVKVISLFYIHFVTINQRGSLRTEIPRSFFCKLIYISKK